jgi:ureidoglycolate hydrolase
MSQPLIAQPITPANFQPYGQVIYPIDDHQPFDQNAAQLVLDQGIPRFYIMRLAQRSLSFQKITRHQKCTQCLGSLAGRDWLLAVAPPGTDVENLQAFAIPGLCFVKLHVGTWHAGPYFTGHEYVDFYNLELSDTNITDHETQTLPMEVTIVPAIKQTQG